MNDLASVATTRRTAIGAIAAAAATAHWPRVVPIEACRNRCAGRSFYSERPAHLAMVSSEDPTRRN